MRHDADLATIQESKLGNEDAILKIRGSDSVCKVREGSGTRRLCGCVHMIYVRQGLQNSFPLVASTNHLEAQENHSHGEQVLPLHGKRLPTTTLVGVRTQCPLKLIVAQLFPALSVETTMHFTSPGTVSQGLNIRATIYSWLVNKNKMVFNDGSTTRASRVENYAGVSVFDITILEVVITNMFP